MKSIRDTETCAPADRIPELEGLRAVLAWTVVLSHVLICSGWFGPIVYGQNLLSDIAEAAVDVFIILSGFVITRLLLVERESYGRYLWRRVCRIFPAYWVALAAGVALNGWLAANLRHFLPNAEAQSFVTICDIGAARSAIDIPLHALLLHGLAPAHLLPAAPYTFLGVAWSLSLEWQFYLVAPIAVALAFRNRAGALSLAIASAATALFAGSIIAQFSNAFLPAKMIFFFVGGCSCVAILSRRPHTVPFVGAISASLAIVWWVGSHRPFEALLPPVCWFAVIVCVRTEHLRALRTVLRSRVAQHLGRVSYSTYLFHAPVITLLQAGIWRYVNPTNRGTLLLLTLPFAIGATALVSHLSWRFVERPCQRFGRLKF